MRGTSQELQLVVPNPSRIKSTLLAFLQQTEKKKKEKVEIGLGGLFLYTHSMTPIPPSQLSSLCS